MTDQKLTELQEFALALLKSEGGEVHTGTLAYKWAEYKTGRHPPCASRDRFGLTSAAHKTMRKLVEMGLAEFNGYSSYTFKPQ
jgi:hypothetical protein